MLRACGAAVDSNVRDVGSVLVLAISSAMSLSQRLVALPTSPLFSPFTNPPGVRSFRVPHAFRKAKRPRACRNAIPAREPNLLRCGHKPRLLLQVTELTGARTAPYASGSRSRIPRHLPSGVAPAMRQRRANPSQWSCLHTHEALLLDEQPNRAPHPASARCRSGISPISMPELTTRG